eukprot:CAMPEP_0194144740 /NCGR_PEP_ID=MMETSP0152-20130528/13752_1 /TAXON_ID=1049557 /ORGANISM="Thalassiothrix antarctica, Strain L6-D1" /LENGTH=256 /DNA_ID=CAMNT_0038844713 /DNA_START=55 /DNA_END=825 /DNA_ORIENTATION=-
MTAEESKTIKNILIVVAMEAEAAPFVKHYGLKPIDNFFDSKAAPFAVFQGEHSESSSQITVVTNGKDSVYGTNVDNVGTAPASLVTFLALQKLPEIDIVLNAGTCGGFKRKGAEIGNVFITSGVANHDRRIPIPGFTEYGVGKIDCINAPKLMETNSDFKSGICTTSNSLDKTDEDDKHMTANDASVKDMEAAAIAWVCSLHQKPYLGIKVVTDIVDGDRPTQDEFMENLGAAAKSLQVALPKVLTHVCGKSISDL